MLDNTSLACIEETQQKEKRESNDDSRYLHISASNATIIKRAEILHFFSLSKSKHTFFPNSRLFHLTFVLVFSQHNKVRERSARACVRMCVQECEMEREAGVPTQAIQGEGNREKKETRKNKRKTAFEHAHARGKKKRATKRGESKKKKRKRNVRWAFYSVCGTYRSGWEIASLRERRAGRGVIAHIKTQNRWTSHTHTHIHIHTNTSPLISFTLLSARSFLSLADCVFHFFFFFGLRFFFPALMFSCFAA